MILLRALAEWLKHSEYTHDTGSFSLCSRVTGSLGKSHYLERKVYCQ